MRSVRAIVAALALLALAACERDMRDMYDQNRPHPDGYAIRFNDGRDARPPPPDSIARASGVLAADSSGRSHVSATSASVLSTLKRGRSRYDIYCAPCHSPVGDGDGMVVRRGFPRPESFHTEKNRALSDADFESAIVDGVGTMKPMSGRIDEADRQAIVAYIHALQLSQHAILDDVPVEERAALNRSSR